MSCQHLYTLVYSRLGTVENHENTEITETVIFFVKFRNFAKMLCFAMFLAKMP